MINDDDSDTCPPGTVVPWQGPGPPVPRGAKVTLPAGPRQTGKTSLIRHALTGVPIYDLLDRATYLALSRDPTPLGQEGQGVAVIDEIQRLPELLNEVHRLIETRGVHFLLTGSSARKLRRSGVNLLGGRARMKYPLPSNLAYLRRNASTSARRSGVPTSNHAPAYR